MVRSWGSSSKGGGVVDSLGEMVVNAGVTLDSVAVDGATVTSVSCLTAFLCA